MRIVISNDGNLVIPVNKITAATLDYDGSYPQAITINTADGASYNVLGFDNDDQIDLMDAWQKFKRWMWFIDWKKEVFSFEPKAEYEVTEKAPMFESCIGGFATYKEAENYISKNRDVSAIYHIDKVLKGIKGGYTPDED